MVKRLVGFALYQPLFLLLLTALFVAGGVVAFRSLPVEAFPDVTDIQTTVITLFPGHAPEEVEKQVTVPLEIALAGVPHAVRMFSHTQFGLSFLTLTFDDQVLIRGEAGAFSDAGDSGSLIVDRATGRATGLLFAGSARFTIANHIADVLAAFGVALVV